MQDTDLSHLKVVVIDDDHGMLVSMRKVLQSFGSSAETFSAPSDAVEWIEAHGADIVLTDVHMPQMSGFDVMDAVKRIEPHAEIILMTAHGNVESAVRALRNGAADFFVKPFEILDLRAAIERTARFRMLTQQQSILAAQVDGLSRALEWAKGGASIMVGKSNAMRTVAESVVAVADSPATVLVTGESGTGKELVARAIHHTSPRKDNSILTINCASIPESLFESQMFGHTKGAFTGASEARMGYVEAAKGGSLFLDEIGDLSPALQGKILRLLEEKVYLPVGGVREREADVRLIAATNIDLRAAAERKEFREDLYYRLSMFTVTIPPLRDRKEDIPLLAKHFVARYAQELGKEVDGLADSALEVLLCYDFPGNVRELRNILENAMIRVRHTGPLTAADIPTPRSVTSRADHVHTATPQSKSWPLPSVNAQEVERMLFTEVLSRTRNNVSAAARELGMSRSKFRHKLTSLGIDH